MSILDAMIDCSTILIKNKTRDLLKQIGRKGQTYDELINELIGKRDSLDRRVESLQSSELRST